MWFLRKTISVCYVKSCRELENIYGSTFFMPLTPVADFRLPRFVLRISELFMTRWLNTTLLNQVLQTAIYYQYNLKLAGGKIRSWWPIGLRHGSAAARFLALRIRIPLRVWLSSSYECCVLSGTGLYDRPNPRPEESYRVCECVCNWVWSSATVTLYPYSE